MIWINTKLLLGLYWRPVSATGAVIDEGHWLYAAVAVAVLSMLLQFTVTSHIYSQYEAVYRPIEKHETATVQNEAGDSASPNAMLTGPLATGSQEATDAATADESNGPDFVLERRPLPLVGNYGWWLVSFAPANFFSTVLGLALLYVPLLLVLVTSFESLGSFGVVLRRDYGPLLTCTLMAWAAGHLPFALAGIGMSKLGLGGRTALVLWGLSALCFALLMAVVVRTLFSVRFDRAVGIVCLAALSFVIQARLFAVVSPYLFSPFLLYYAYSMFRGDIGDIGFSLRQRQSFRCSMEDATINPRNAEAHYQLGLIFQHRHQYNEAIERFKRAVEIDPEETDAQYQLGRIARSQNRLQEALDHFSVVISQDEQHGHCEIWREIGLTYLNASMYAEADDALRRFVENRPYDPEGLYYYGQTLNHLGDSKQAIEIFRRCVEAVKTMPHYRRGHLHKWRKLAQDQLARRPQAA